ncbi:MAG: tandem-95 repeat protein [Phycisphaerales bacterium]
MDAETGDSLEGATDGNDTFTGMSGDDIAAAMDGNDNLFGMGGNDSLDGGAGDDLLSGGAGDDTLDGGSGTDTASFADTSDRVVVDLEAGTATGQGSDSLIDIENIDGSGGDDIIRGDSGGNTIDAGAGNDYIEGRGGDDVIRGGAGADIIDAGAGDDLVSGGTGDDVLIGGSGNDTVSFDGSAAGVDVDLDAESATGDGQDTVIDFENIIGSDHDDTIAGDASANTIDGGSGNDVIQGRGGNDTLNGGAGSDNIDGGSGDDLVSGGTGNDTIAGGDGSDTLFGEAGDDVLDGGADADTLSGGSGNDQLRGGAGDDILKGGAGNDSIEGGEGTDTVSYEDVGNAVTVDLGAGTASGDGNDTIAGVENVVGSSAGDSITGDSGGNTIDGGAGNDVLDGGAGDDTLQGGAGDDVLTGGAGADIIDGGAGDDTIHADADDVITGGSGTDTVSFTDSDDPVRFDLAASGVEQVIGSANDDVFSVSNASDGDHFVIDGGGGYNVLDLSAYDASDVSVEDGVVTVELDGGGSFTVGVSGVDHFVAGGTGETPTVMVDDMVVAEGESVRIDGATFSPSESPASYSWTQVSGPAVDLSGSDTNQPAFDAPELDSNAVLRFRVEVSDADSTGVQYVTVAVAADNDPVVVDLGPDQNVSEGDTVTLNATVVDPEGYATVQRWEQVSGPTVEISNADSLSPTFTAAESDGSADLVFKFTASDGETEVVEYVTVHVEAENDAALVDAGADFEVEEGDTVNLVGSATDPEGEELTFSWRQVSGPTVIVTDADSANATFEAPEGVVNTDIRFELTASDGVNESVDSVTVTINADDDAPEFTSLPKQTVGEHEAVELSAAASDPEGNGVTYSWRQVGGSPVELSGSDTQNPTFTSPEEITNSWLKFEVTASDGSVSSVGTVEVLVNAVNDAPAVDAGAGFVIDAGETGSLSASGEDPEGKEVLFNWTQVSGPSVNISDATSADATFGAPTLDEDAELVFQVEVTDGTSTSVDTVTVSVNAAVDSDGGGDPGGEPGDDPGGDTGEPSGDVSISVKAPATIVVTEGQIATLGVDVSGASGDVEYTWTQVAGTQTIELSGGDTASPSFEAPNLTNNEIYSFDVTVEDDTGSHTVRVDMLVEAENEGPAVDVDETYTQVRDSIYGVGSTASDAEGQNLSYRWVQTDGPEVKIRSGNSPELRFSTRGMAEAGEVTFELQVSDGTNISTDLVVLDLEPGNTLPEISAGPDQSVTEGDAVQLTSAASDEDGDELTYTWVQTGGPAVELSDANSPTPVFEAPDVSGSSDITFELTVSDGLGEVTDSVTISVEGVNDPPVVDAGSFQSVQENDVVTLAGSVSDSDSEELTYNWRQTGGPAVAITGGDSAAASFTAPDQVSNSYVTFELEVSDGEHTVVDSVVVLVNADNDAPSLDTGPDFSVAEETTVQLSASATDPEGSPLSHEWVQTGGPSVTLSDPFSIDPTFDSPNVASDTELTFQISTTDGAHTVVDTITVTVIGENDAPEPINATTMVTEDTPSSVVLTGTDPDIDQEVTEYRIDSLPAAGTLTFAGDPVVSGDVFTAEQIESGGLIFTPPADYSGTTDVTFSVSDGDAWSAESATQTIVVVGEADAPVVTTADATGTEESAIALNVGVALTDADGSESISSVRVSGAPAGSVLTDGVTTVTAWDGSADISGLNLSDLQILPADNHDQDFTLTIAATSVEADGGDSTTGAATLIVHIDAVNDPPVALDGSMEIREDETAVISLGSQEVDTGDEAANFRIESLPTNGTLMLDGVAVEAGDEVSAYDVSRGRLTFEPTGDWSGATGFDFSVSDGEVWSESEATLTIEVTGVADAPLLTVTDANGFEDSPIALDVSAAITDTDGSEEISRIAVSGAPAGSVLTDGVNTETAFGQPVDITGWDLSSLSVTPAPNYDTDFDVEIEVTAREPDSGHTTTTTAEINVQIDGTNDAPIVQAGSVEIEEDGVATIVLNTTEVDTGDAVESLRIDSTPANGTLILDGVEVAEGQIIDKSIVDSGSLTFEPDENWSGTTSLRFSAFDGELWSESEGEHTIQVGAVVDDAMLGTADASGFEDTAVDLDVSAALTDTDGSETLSVKVTGVPDGASLSAGTENSDGTWTLAPDQLDGLQITPPDDFSGSFELEFTATTAEASGETASVAGTVRVDVEGVADTPALTTGDRSGFEDTPIALDISSSLSDTDGSETLSVVVSGVPDGAALSAGTDNGDGSWTLSPGQLDGLAVTPPSDYSGSFDLTVTAISTEADGDTALTSSTFAVSVEGVADGPAVSTEDAAGAEDSAISLDVSSSLADIDGSETLGSIVISGVPDGASLSAGADNGDGTWTLDPTDLDGLAVTPPSDYSGSFDLTVTASSTEADGDTAETTSVVSVDVTGVADTPVLSVSDASGFEDAPISLDIGSSVSDTDGSETLAITIADVPDGASLSAGVDNGDGTWTLAATDLDGLTVTPPSNYSGSFDLNVIATSAESDGDTASTNATITVDVEGIADAPAVLVSDATGAEDSAISLDISSSLADIDGSETLAITIAGVPDGASLSAGTDNGDGTWTLAPADLSDLQMTPPSDFSGSIDLNVTVMSSEADGDTASTTETVHVEVSGVADTPMLSVSDAFGSEDAPINLDISSSLSDVDGSETLAITVAGVPDGATLSAGVDNGDGSWTLSPGQLDGLSVTPPSDYSGSFDLTVTAISTEADGDTASTSSTFAVSVEGVADGPAVSTEDAAGAEDSAISLDISSSLADIDGSETLGNIVISGVPDGASLSAGADNGDGTWTLETTDLDGLTVTPPSNYSGSFDLTVTATSAESDGDTASTNATITVDVEGVADAPTLTVSDAFGSEDGAISLDISSTLTDVDGSEMLESIVISGVPDGAMLSAGIDNADGTWTLAPGDLDGLTVTPPSDYSGSFDLSVIATSAEADGDTASTNATISVDVEGVADGPELSVEDASGREDSAISLDISSTLTDVDGSETLAVTIEGVPDGATLSAGVDNGDGSWTLSSADLDGLTVTPSGNYSGSFDLDITAVAVESDGDTEAVRSSITVDVAGVADAIELTVNDVFGSEDSAIGLDISAALMDTDGSEDLSLVISGVPDGASLSAGVDIGNGTWQLMPADLDELTVTPPSNYSGSFDLTISATNSEVDGDAAHSTATMGVTVEPVADASVLETSPAEGAHNSPIPLSIATSLTDTDGSESLQITINGLPTGSTLSAGSDNGDGSWTLSPSELNGLTFTPPPGVVGQIQLDVVATSTDGTSDAISSSSLDVSVYPIESSEEAADESPVPEQLESGPPGEIDWSGENEIGMVSSGSDFEGAFDEIDSKLEEIADSTPELAEEVSQVGKDFIGEISPLVSDASETGDSIAPPDEPLFEFVRAVNDDRGEDAAQDSRAGASSEATEQEANTESQRSTAAGRFSGTFGVLWGLVRSLGVRDNNEDTHSSRHASRGRRG